MFNEEAMRTLSGGQEVGEGKKKPRRDMSGAATIGGSYESRGGLIADGVVLIAFKGF